MYQRFLDHWPEIMLALFAVAAGQIGRLGQKLERGETVGWRHVIVELSMFPAFGAMAGALGVEMGWPIWIILGAGITAGWLGFFTFRLITKLMLGLLRGLGKGFLSADSWLLSPNGSLDGEDHGEHGGEHAPAEEHEPPSEPHQ